MTIIKLYENGDEIASYEWDYVPRRNDYIYVDSESARYKVLDVLWRDVTNRPPTCVVELRVEKS